MGFTEILLIAFLFIVLIGPKELPVVLKMLAKGYKQYRALKHKLGTDFNAALHSIEQIGHQESRIPDQSSIKNDDQSEDVVSHLQASEKSDHDHLHSSSDQTVNDQR